MKNASSDIDTIRELHRAGQLNAAKEGYLKILREHPQHVEALHSLGVLYAQEENYTDAIETLETALKLQPFSTVISLHLANILKISGLFNRAIETLQNLLIHHPHYAPALNNLGTVYYAQGKLDDATHYYRAAIAEQTDYVDAYYNLGLALTKQNKFSEAIETYKKILPLAPDHFAARFQLASALMHEQNIEDAIRIFLRIAEVHPNHFETQTNLASCYVNIGDLKTAKQYYTKALELSPEDSQILFNLGVIHMQQGNIDSAIRFYQRAAQIEPDNFSVHNNLGIACLAKQHIGFALEHFKEALRIQPNNKAIQHTIKIMSGHENLLTSPPEYITSLFDSYADHYESHLLKALDYQVPELLQNALLKVTHPPKQNWDIIDLGCGTGLCGSIVKPYAKTLIGVDLSAKMLEIAAQKNIYDELITSDLTHFLKNKKSTYDLVIAGDVFVYIGDLAPLFSEISTALREKGFLVFNAEIEINEESDFKINQSGRFLHHKKYLEILAANNNFSVAFYQTSITRTQNNEPVYGHIFVLKKDS